MYASRNLGCDIRGYIPSAKAKGFYALYYKKYKEKLIKKIADEYKDEIPIKLYDAMYRYEVEITD